MIRRSIFALALAVLVAGLALAFALGPKRASAHGEPEITVRPASAAAGDTITIEGEGFEAGSEVRLTLVAASGRSDLGTVIADEEGAFHFEASLPQWLAAGSLEVHAESGEDRAVARFTIAGAAAAEAEDAIATQISLGVEQEADGHVLLTATLIDAQGQPVAAAPVHFLVVADLLGVTSEVEVATATTNVDGVATAEYTPTFAGSIQAIARFEGVGFYGASESSSTLEVTEFQPAYTVEKAALAPLRRWAPLGLALVVLGVWATFGFVVYQIYRIARAGGEA